MSRFTSLALVCFLSIGCGKTSDTSSPDSQTEPAHSDSIAEAETASSGKASNSKSSPAEIPDPNSDEPSISGEANDKNSSKDADDLLAGRPFEVQSAEIKEGILELRQGDDTFADNKLTLFLFLEEDGVIPEGESFVVKKDDQSFDHPHIHMKYKGPDDRFSQTETYLNDYEMTLKFGEEEEKGKLPFTIDLKLPHEKETRLQGEFVADVTGFRIIDGKVDLTSDSFKTLEFVAKNYLSEQHEGNAIEIVSAEDGMFSHPDPKNSRQQIGRNIYEYKVGEGESQRVKLIFVKEEAGWTLADQIALHQLFLAHPVFAPNEDSRRGDYAQQVVAQHLEKEFADREEPPYVHGVQLVVGYVPSSDYSKVRARYHLGASEQQVQRAFVTKGRDDSCELIREIDYDARIDPKTGEVKAE
ncbi:MAG: hypothetical protein HUJ26_15050 [Planctomycetaceae bacterium]|nr:hypothetical protein [Planctomycetaceae bacterium]